MALDVVSDMLLTPTLRQADIDREKGVIIEELNMYVDTPASHISNVFDRMMFGSDGLGHDIIGTKDTIRSMTTQHFQDFLNQWYGLENLVLIVAGDAKVVNSESLLAEINQAFAKGQVSQRQTGKQSLKKFLAANPISEQQLQVVHRQTEQAHFILGWPGLKRSDKDRYAGTLLSTILGGNMSSRLFTEVREKRGLCYYVHSDIDTYHNTGVFGAAAGVDPNRVEEALEVTKQQFTDLVSSDQAQITQQELDKAKAYTAGKMALGLEDSESVAQYFGMKQLLEDKITTPAQVLEKIQAVTLDQVQAMAQRLIAPGEMRLAMIGPFEQKSFDKFVAN
jgi:predicted Zn-dependent peptidase